MIRRWIAVATLVPLLATLSPAKAQAEEWPVRVVVDEIELQSDVPPTLVDGRTLVPFRAIAESLGVTVTWVGESQTVLAEGQGSRLRLVVGSHSAQVNGVDQWLDVAPQIISGRTMVPARIFAEAFDSKVAWEGESQTVRIASALRPMRTLAFYGLGSYEYRSYIPRFADVAFTWATLTADGGLVMDQGEYFWPEGAGEVLTMAQKAGVGRYLSIVASDLGDRVTRLVLNPKARAQLAGEIESVVREQGLSGVVLDLEDLGYELSGDRLSQVRQGYTALVQEVAKRLHPLGKEVIAAVPPPNGWYPGYDYAAIAAQADQLLVMAYPYGSVGPEPLDRVEEAVHLSLAEVAPAKLLLGILVEHETRETMAQKVALAKRHNLSGIAVWILRSLDQPEMEAIESLVTPLRR